MITWIDEIPTGDIVILGVYDSANNSMTTDAYTALRTLGYSSTTSPLGGWDSLALIGIKGSVDIAI